jgi:hypothetical protein
MTNGQAPMTKEIPITNTQFGFWEFGASLGIGDWCLGFSSGAA